MKLSNKKIGSLIVLAILMVITALATYFWLKNQDPTKGYSPKYTIEQDKAPNVSDIADKSKTSPNNGLPQTTEEIPRSTTGSITIEDLEQKNGFVNTRASTSNFTVTTCVYEFTSEGARPITRETTGSCGGVSIPQAEFEKIGTYTLQVTAYSSTQKLSSSKNIDIR